MATPIEHGHPITELDQSSWVTIITSLMMTYMILLHLARLMIRYTINGPFGADDHVISVGVVFAIIQSGIKIAQANAGLGKSISIVDHSRIEQIQKTGYVADIFYLIALTLSKCGTLLLICRVTRMKKHLYPAYIGCGFTAIWGIASIFALSIRCDMPHPWENPNSCSGDLYTRWLAIGVIGIAIEMFTVWLPVYLVWNLHMPFASKFVVVFAFSFRLPVIITAILHIFYIHRETHSTDPLLYGAASSVCMETCLHYSLMAATIPCMKPFIKSFNTGFLSHKADQGGYGSSNDHNSGNYPLSTLVSSKRGSRYHSSAKKDHFGAVTNIEPTNEAQQDDSPSLSEDGSDKMIIRRTTAWQIRYDESSQP